ncbi:MAG: metallopeptidase [Lachnospiraceae bacterium]|nr:metallopeptidase [Lachnospiraceae bacterium]
MFEEKLIEKVDICNEILKDCRNELYLNLRFLDVALHSLAPEPSMALRTTATDGRVFRYNPEYFVEQYKIGNVMVNRCYLHSLFHCLFGHLWHRRKPEEKMLWDLSCDIAVEYLLDGLPCRCLRNPPKPYRRAVYDGLLKKIPVIHGEGVFHLLQKAEPDVRILARMIQEFSLDDHFLWNQEDSGQKAPMEQQEQWKDIRDKMETELDLFSKEAAEDSKGLKEQLHIENRERYDYRSFLKKFCVLKEEMQVDLDSFDYIFYNYGMELYGNMPLIEHQETREMQKIEDFVIVIDTSMSCKAVLVQKFLEETYQILSQSESFYRRFCIHIIQCDERVQSDLVIENQKQLREYMEGFQVQGMGGTDFRPAFAYVDQLLAEKAFRKLRGLIYFTDGYGTYPLKKPVYDTAFVFFREDYQDVDVPPWAIKLILGEEEIIEM